MLAEDARAAAQEQAAQRFLNLLDMFLATRAPKGLEARLNAYERATEQLALPAERPASPQETVAAVRFALSTDPAFGQLFRQIGERRRERMLRADTGALPGAPDAAPPARTYQLGRR